MSFFPFSPKEQSSFIGLFISQTPYKMISLLPCYSLEDFSLYRQSSEVDEIFSAWSALYHPALVAHFGEAPRWEAAGSPSTGKQRRLVVVPPCTEYLVSHSWLKSAEKEGAIVIRHVSDRDEILKIAFEKLGIAPSLDSTVATDLSSNVENNGEQVATNCDDQSVCKKSQTIDNSNLAQSFPYDDAAESFLAVGLCCLLEELLTRKLRYMSNLDQVSFNTRVVDAAKAHMSGNVEEREKNLQKAFDLLTTSKEYFFPTATKFLDLTWTLDEDLENALPQELLQRRLRNEKTNLVLPVPLLNKCEKEYPQTFELLKEEVQAKRVVLIGGDKWEAPLYLMSPTEIVRALREGRNEYLRAFGIAPVVFGRQEQGYSQLLPQLLSQTGYRGVLARTGDGWSLLEKPSDRSVFRWQGRDGSTIATLCKKALDATSSEDILQMPDKIGNSYYSDDASAIVFEHRPCNESRWLRDILRMDRYSPVLGKFYDIDDYFRVSEGAGDKEKFVKDRFKTNFLTRSGKRDKTDLVSLWVKRQRLGIVESALDNLETSIRVLTLKCKHTPDIANLFDEYVALSSQLKDDAAKTLASLDEYLLPVEKNDSATLVDFDELTKRFEKNLEQLLGKASRYLTQAILAQNAQTEDERRGFLFVNVNSMSKNICWEMKSTTGKIDVERLKAIFTETLNLKYRSFVNDSSNIAQFMASLPPGKTVWLPQLCDYEYHFLDRPFFDTERLIKQPLAGISHIQTEVKEKESEEIKAPRKSSFLQKMASKLRGDTPNIAQGNVEDSENANGAARSLAEYVVKRYSATEIEKHYLLKNDSFEIRIDPVSGMVKRVTTFGECARFSNGVLRQPGMGNRLAWDLAFKLTEKQRQDDRRPADDPCYGYTTPAADSIEILASAPGIGQIKTTGRLVAPDGELAGKFTQTITIQLKSKVVDVDVEFDPCVVPDPKPWESYFGCRFAWKDTLAEIRGGVGTALIGTARDYIQAPECVDIRSDEQLGITILSGALPYYRKVSDTRMDAILIPRGESKRRFHFAIGVDLVDPHSTALAYLAPSPLRIDNVPKPKRVDSSFLTSNSANARILSTKPILADPNNKEKKSATRLAGVQLTLLETHSIKTKTEIRSFLSIERIEELDFNGQVIKESIELANANLVELTLSPRQMRIFNVYFKKS